MDQTAPTSNSVSPLPASTEQVITPWDVQGQVLEDGQQLGINYDKLIDQFGTRRIDAVLLQRFENVTGHKPHLLLRRGTFFSHRCDVISSHLFANLTQESENSIEY